MSNKTLLTAPLTGETKSVYWLLHDRYPTIWEKLVKISREKRDSIIKFRRRKKKKEQMMPDAKVIFTRQAELNENFYILNIAPPNKYRVVFHTRKLRHTHNVNSYEEAKIYRDEYIRANNIKGLKFPMGDDSYIRINPPNPDYKVRIPVIMPDGTRQYWYQKANSIDEAKKIRNDFMLSHKVIFRNSKRNVKHLSYSDFDFDRWSIKLSYETSILHR